MLEGRKSKFKEKGKGPAATPKASVSLCMPKERAEDQAFWQF